MTEARSLLLERFDGDVRRRLRLAGEQAKEAVEPAPAQDARALTGTVLGKGARGRRRWPRPPTRCASTADGASLPPARRAPRCPPGWRAWRAARAGGSSTSSSSTGLKPEEKLVHLVLVKERDGLPGPATRRTRALTSRSSRRGGAAPAARRRLGVAHAQEQALFTARDELLREAERRNALELDRLREQRGPLRRGLPARVARGPREGTAELGGGPAAARRASTTRPSGPGHGQPSSGRIASIVAGSPRSGPRRRPATA